MLFSFVFHVLAFVVCLLCFVSIKTNLYSDYVCVVLFDPLSSFRYPYICMVIMRTCMIVQSLFSPVWICVDDVCFYWDDPLSLILHQFRLGPKHPFSLHKKKNQ